MSPFARKAWLFPALCALFAASALASPDTKDRPNQDQPARYDTSRQGISGHDPDSLRGSPDSPLQSAAAEPVFLGADLSYVNEMEDCGGVYRENGQRADPFALFAERGANLARVRLWHTPPSRYSAFPDVQRTIRRAKDAGMQVLLDFHYSDHWADPGKQVPPAAWNGLTIRTGCGTRSMPIPGVCWIVSRKKTCSRKWCRSATRSTPAFLLPHGSREPLAAVAQPAGGRHPGGARRSRPSAKPASTSCCTWRSPNTP